MSPVALLVATRLNRILGDYPQAKARLAGHAGKKLSVVLGPVTQTMRVTSAGDFEPVGAGGLEAPDISITIPLALLPRLASQDASAFNEVVFTGDSEFAATLSTIARNVRWDVEEDLAQHIGDIAAHRVVGSAKAASQWAADAGARVRANAAEYLTHERRTFMTQADLATLVVANQSLRDRVARLEARLSYLVTSPAK